MAPAKPLDPWGQVWGPNSALAANSNRGLLSRSALAPQVDDIEGTALYTTLDVDPNATSEEIKKVRRTAAPLPPAAWCACRTGCCAELCVTFSITGCLPPSFGRSASRPTASWPSSTTLTRAATPPRLRACKPRLRC